MILVDQHHPGAGRYPTNCRPSVSDLREAVARKLSVRPENVVLGMEVQLTTYPIGTDGDGTEAIAFGYEPAPVKERTL